MATELLGQGVLGAGEALRAGAESLNINGWPVKERRMQSQRQKAEEHLLEHTYRRAVSSSAQAAMSSTKRVKLV